MSIGKDVVELWRRGSHLVRMTRIMDSGFMADCTFLLRDRKGEEARIPGHRALLSFVSPVFQAMLSEVWRSEESREIRIRDVTAETFRLLLEYVYTDQVAIPDMDSALELLSTAHMYLIDDLVDRCVAYIIVFLEAENVCQVLKRASPFSLGVLRSSAIKFLVENTSAVLCAASFPECSAATLRLILEQDSLSLSSELELVQACLRWGQHQVEQRAKDKQAPLTVRAALGDLVFLLRLRGLSSEQVARHVVPSGLLTKDEQNALLCCLVTNGDSPMPEGFTNKIRTILRRNEVDCSTMEMMHEAILMRDVWTVKLLLETGFPADGRVETVKENPLGDAACQGDVDIVRLLLDHGADMRVKIYTWKGSPLHCAALNGHTDVVKLLIERGSEVNLTDIYGRTPLVCTIDISRTEIVRVLLKAGANTRILDVEGDTPLHLAIKEGQVDLVHMLLEAGANPKATNKKGETPLLLASLQAEENREMVDTIKQYFVPTS